MNPALEAATNAAGIELDQGMAHQLALLGAWLVDEAMPAGGLGPHEQELIEGRHLVDCMSFAGAWPVPPTRCWDLGTGAGLPGLVLACVWPDTEMILVDSSARRCDLARRGARVIGARVAVRQVRIEDLHGPCEAIVSRAAIPARRLGPILRRLLPPGAVAVVSGSGMVDGFEPVPGSEFLDGQFFDGRSRLLMMRSP